MVVNENEIEYGIIQIWLHSPPVRKLNCKLNIEMVFDKYYLLVRLEKDKLLADPDNISLWLVTQSDMKWMGIDLPGIQYSITSNILVFCVSGTFHSRKRKDIFWYHYWYNLAPLFSKCFQAALFCPVSTQFLGILLMSSDDRVGFHLGFLCHFSTAIPWSIIM